MIEQKGKDIDLNRGYKQSDGSMLTPFQQARRYAGYLPHDLNPRWIIVCKFQEVHIHDMNRPNDPFESGKGIQPPEFSCGYRRCEYQA